MQPRPCAIVTGAGSGIGRATARLLARQGALVAVLDVDACGAKGTTDLVRGEGSDAFAVVADIAVRDQVDVAVAEVAAREVPTILVNNAGIASGGGILDTDLDAWDHTLAVNLTGTFLMLRAVAARMVRHGAGGSIVNVSSSSAFRALNAPAAYAASKAGIGALTRVAAGELGQYGITVNTVAPGVTRTPLTESAFGGAAGLEGAVRDGPLANLLRRVSEPEDIAEVIAFLCSPNARQVTGQVVHVSGGAVIPA